jgi:hypothetical protein
METPVAAPPSPRCTATVRAEVHLRPTATPRTVGAPWPAGTTFEVLGVDPWLRREIPGDEDEGVLAEVRVVASGDRGWTFVRYTELAPECPLFLEPPPWGRRPPTTPAERANCTRAPRHARGAWNAERGPRRFRPQVLPCCPSAQSWRVIERLDLDGDGSRDELVLAARDCACMRDYLPGDEKGAVVALLRRPGGWLGEEVIREIDPEHDPGWSSYDGELRAGSAVYLRWSVDDHLLTEERGLPSRVSFSTAWSGLTRIDGCGVGRVVARVVPPLAGECTWAGNSDGSVELVCRRPARRALLRWDEGRFELVPDRSPMPWHGGDTP